MAASSHEPFAVSSYKAGERVDDVRKVLGECRMPRARHRVCCQLRCHDPSAARRCSRRNTPFATAAARHLSFPVHRAASASVARNIAFHSVSTLSSTPGRGRSSRAASRALRHRSIMSGRPMSGRAWMRLGIERPSKLPSSVIPQCTAASCAQSPRMSASSAGVHV